MKTIRDYPLELIEGMPPILDKVIPVSIDTEFFKMVGLPVIEVRRMTFGERVDKMLIENRNEYLKTKRIKKWK